MSKTAWIIFAAIVVVLFGGLIIISHNSNPSSNVSDVDTNTIQVASDQNGNIADHVFGKADSKVVLIEYGDIQCPSCGAAYPQLKAVSEEYKDQIAFVFRNFPLTTLHPNARAAAAAAEAAGLQDKYWEMHNYLYENQAAWETLTGDDRTNYFVNAANQLALNTDTFRTDIASPKVNQKISFDQAIGKKLNVNATPTIYFQGAKVSDDIANDIVQGTGDKLRALINAELDKRGITKPVTAS